jgi:hypothetical protein
MALIVHVSVYDDADVRDRGELFSAQVRTDLLAPEAVDLGVRTVSHIAQSAVRAEMVTFSGATASAARTAPPVDGTSPLPRAGGKAGGQ